MILDWQHEENRKAAFELREEGYTFNITADGYSLRFKNEFLEGVGVKLPRERPLHYKHARENVREYLGACVRAALRHKDERAGK